MRSSMCIAQPSNANNANAKALLDRIVAMLTKLGQPGYAVHETPSGRDVDRIDTPTPTPTVAKNREPANTRMRRSAVAPADAQRLPNNTRTGVYARVLASLSCSSYS